MDVAVNVFRTNPCLFISLCRLPLEVQAQVSFIFPAVKFGDSFLV